MLNDPDFNQDYVYTGLISPSKQVTDAYWLPMNISVCFCETRSKRSVQVYKGKNLDPQPPAHRRYRHYHGNVTDHERLHKGTIADVTDTLKATYHRP
jgi:hypothetical protein